MSAPHQLPEPDARAWLLAALRDVLEDTGFHTFVSGPIVEPSDRFFPDPPASDAQGVRRLALRLLRHAGQDDVGVRVCTLVEPGDDATEEELHVHETWPEGAIAWIVDADEERVVLGFDPDALATRAPESVVSAVAREIARFDRRAATGSEAPSEHLIDVASVALGFGVLLTNLALRIRSKGDVDWARRVATSWNEVEAGSALRPNDLAFLLAVQCVARGGDRAERERIARLLEPDQKRSFTVAFDVLEGEDVLGVLGLPAQSAWPARREPDRGTIVDDPSAVSSPRDSADAHRLPNEGQVVFRVVRTRAIPWAFGGAIAGIVLGTVLVASDGPPTGLAAVLVLGAIGAIAGRRVRDDECSAPECLATLPDGARHCPRCGGEIAHEIASHSDRLAAEEALEPRRSRGRGYREKAR